jgi:hypothetical protein
MQINSELNEVVVEGHSVYDVHRQLIEVDRWITYPVRRGSDMWLAHGKVTRVRTVKRPVWRGDVRLSTEIFVTKLSGKKTTVACTSNIVVAPRGWEPPAGSL